MKKIKEEFGNPPVYITENGLSDAGELEDNQRILYLYSYMKAMLIAIKEYDCNLKGYTVWSLLDNFEWERGYRYYYYHYYRPLWPPWGRTLSGGKRYT